MAKQPETPRVLQSFLAAFGLREVFFFGGMALLTIGAAQVYGPAGYLVPGAILAWLGYRK